MKNQKNNFKIGDRVKLVDVSNYPEHLQPLYINQVVVVTEVNECGVGYDCPWNRNYDNYSLFRRVRKVDNQLMFDFMYNE